VHRGAGAGAKLAIGTWTSAIVRILA
jgi:hypothetical protein